jgi:hypothetical protein
MPQSVQFDVPGSPPTIASRRHVSSEDIARLADAVPIEIRQMLGDAAARAWQSSGGIKRSFSALLEAFELELLKVAPRRLNRLHCGPIELVENQILALLSGWFARAARAEIGTSTSARVKVVVA